MGPCDNPGNSQKPSCGVEEVEEIEELETGQTEGGVDVGTGGGVETENTDTENTDTENGLDKVPTPNPPGGGVCNEGDNNAGNESWQSCGEEVEVEENKCDVDPSECEEPEVCELGGSCPETETLPPDPPEETVEPNICEENPNNEACIDPPAECELGGECELEIGVVEETVDEIEFCKLDENIGHESCVDPPISPEEGEGQDSSCYSESGSQLFVSRNKTCTVPSLSGESATQGYKSLVLYENSGITLVGDDLTLSPGTDLFYLRPGSVVKGGYGVLAAEGEYGSKLKIYLSKDSSMDVDYIQGSANDNTVVISPDASLELGAKGFVSFGGNDSILNHGSVSVGSISG